MYDPALMLTSLHTVSCTHNSATPLGQGIYHSQTLVFDVEEKHVLVLYPQPARKQAYLEVHRHGLLGVLLLATSTYLVSCRSPVLLGGVQSSHHSSRRIDDHCPRKKFNGISHAHNFQLASVPTLGDEVEPLLRKSVWDSDFDGRAVFKGHG
eukprot:1677134-Rhodomonas_salina.3